MPLEVYRCIEKRINENRRKEDFIRNIEHLEKKNDSVDKATCIVLGFAFGSLTTIFTTLAFVLMVKSLPS